MGTAAYMSPEQARGKPVDKRADIWSFGVVLFEMLTGKRAFEGDDVSLTLSAVLQREPEWEMLPPNIPHGLDTYLRRCLQKGSRQRVQAIGDVRLAMEGAFETTVSAPSEAVAVPRLQVWQRPVPALLVVLATLVFGGLGVWTFARPDGTSTALMQFDLNPLDTAPLRLTNNSRDLAISTDGTRVVYNGPGQLYVRSVDQTSWVPVRGGEGSAPFFSPDGEWVGFYDPSATNLQKVSILGGPPVTLAESPRVIRGATWGTDDRIIFGTLGAGLFRVSGGGGELEILTTPDTEQGEVHHQWPFIIPGREAVVFVVSTGAPRADGQLAVLDFDSGEITPLGLAGVSPHYVSTGHLVYAAEDGSVRAVPFDVASLEVTGNPVPLVEEVVVKGSGAADFTISDNGTLVYVLGRSRGAIQRSLVWVDREGREDPIAAPPRGYVYPRISPENTRVALDVRDEEDDIWVWDLAGETLSRLTFAPEADEYGHWAPDGRRVIFNSARDGGDNIYWKAADGTGTAEPLTENDLELRVNAVTPDGTRIIASTASNGAEPRDLMVVTLDGDGATDTLVGTEFDERNAALSLDGAWVAFESDSTGQSEVYVRPFPDVESGQWLVSTGGGRFPVWARDGSELFFLAGTKLMAVPVQTDGGFTRGTAEVLFDEEYFVRGIGRNYDVAPDGRFLMIKNDAAPAVPQINVVLNWFQELTERVPTN